MSPATIIQIHRAVIIFEQMGINGLCIAINIIHQGPTQVPLERTCGRIGNCDLQAAGFFVGVDVIGCKNQIVFSVSFNNGWCPNRTPNPGKILHIHDIFMAFPVDQIL